MKKSEFTLIELLVVLAIVAIVIGMIFGAINTTPQATQARVKENAESWLDQQGLTNEVKRFTAAHDSDHDGYGSVTIVLNDGERIFLQCGSKPNIDYCKEVDTQQKMNVKVNNYRN